jgi:hypothetical protein
MLQLCGQPPVVSSSGETYNHGNSKQPDHP